MAYRPPKLLLLMSSTGLAIGVGVMFKEYVGGCQYQGREKLSDNTAIVTGSNTGIGKEVARELAKRGARVIMACRNVDKCNEARKEIVLETQNPNVFCQKLDLASGKSVRAFAENMNQLPFDIHLLINNAGVMRCPKSLTEDGFEMQLGVNHLGHFLLTLLLLEKLKLSPSCRIINVSSIAHARGEINFEDLNSCKKYDPGKAYSQSKLANVLFTRELAKKLKGSNVMTCAVHPGIVYTEIFRHMGFANSYVSSVFVKPFLWLFSKTPRQGAQPILHCALAPEVQNQNGKYFSNCAPQEPSAQALDDEAARRLWLISERWTRLV